MHELSMKPAMIREAISIFELARKLVDERGDEHGIYRIGEKLTITTSEKILDDDPNAGHFLSVHRHFGHEDTVLTVSWGVDGIDESFVIDFKPGFWPHILRHALNQQENANDH